MVKKHIHKHFSFYMSLFILLYIYICINLNQNIIFEIIGSSFLIFFIISDFLYKKSEILSKLDQELISRMNQINDKLNQNYTFSSISMNDFAEIYKPSIESVIVSNPSDDTKEKLNKLLKKLCDDLTLKNQTKILSVEKLEEKLKNLKGEKYEK